MELLILSAILSAACAAPMQQSLSVRDDGSYQFFYETGPDGGQHSRTEVRHPDGVVVGKYSYEDANGAIREVNYRADDQGYVEGGQVPAPAAPVKEEEEPSSSPVVAPEEEPQPEESVAVETKPDEEESPKSEDKEELSLEEPSSDDPPEAFPPGFFLQNFHGLRRLPEPTEEDKPVPSTEAPKVEEPPQEDNETEPQKDEESKGGEKTLSGDASFFPHLRPFQSFAPQPMDTSMFRAPVYVFSYQHPDSYGYHYVF